MAPIKVNRNIHNSGSGRHCMHIEIDIEGIRSSPIFSVLLTERFPGSRIRYDAGDHVAVYPKNNEDLVNKLGSLLNIDMDQVFTLINLDEDSSKKHPFPCPTTYRTALSHYVEITALPRTHILKVGSKDHRKKKLEINDEIIRSCPATPVIRRRSLNWN